MNLRYVAIFILAIQVIPLVFAETNCTGYHDMFTVNVLDGNLKPVSNATVIVKYDRGQSFGDKYFITPPKQTDASGQILYDIYNGGTNVREIDCKIEINATAGGADKSVTIEAGKHGPTVDVIMSDVFSLKFFVRDQFRAALPNATVNVGNYSGVTDGSGMYFKEIKEGVYPYFASYVDASQAGSINISNDTEFEVLFPHYRITVDVSDDTGTPLPATLTIFNKTFEMQDGHFENEKTFGDSVPYTVNYRGIITEGTISPATLPIVELIYDINAPLFGNITPQTMNDRYQLQIEVWDPNEFADGLDISSMKMYYKLEPSDATTPWSNAVVYTTGRNKFTADFPKLPPDSIVKFRAEVKDKAGNRAEKEGKFSTYAVAPPVNNTGNETNPQPPPSQEQGIPLIYILGGVIVLVLGLYLVFRMKSKPPAGA
jgi:hypothetical protein